MNYGRKTPSTYRSNPSVHSHATTGRSAISRSTRSLKIPWYQRAYVKNNQYFNIQKGSIIMGIVAAFISLFTIGTGIFDLYCYSMAAPGSTHYGYYIISYEFVYVGNTHVRNILVIFALFSALIACVTFVTSCMLVAALRKEHEQRIMPWLWSFGIFIGFRFVAFLFFAIVNDLYFFYNIFMTILWIMLISISMYGWLTVYSVFIELADLTKLEDLAHLRIGTMQSLNASAVQSLAGSRPTTPHSSNMSTMPATSIH
ncbi:uncharacterized protein pasi2 [Chironomus tepperi]|uniref:uncharacterized protein pasi2 n=1 Tax=Chironomus tepperi TaxID=113505 RepID=UPI00391F48E2